MSEKRPATLFAAMVLFAAFIPVSLAQHDSRPVINEIMYNPPSAMGADNDYEWVEIYNPSNTAVQLDGWTLTAGNFETELSGTIFPDGYAIVAKELFDSNDADSGCFLCYYEPIEESVLLLQGRWSYLSNNGAALMLCNPDKSYCDEATYTKSMGANGDGSTLERVSAFSQQWLPSTDTDAHYAPGKPDGTPGRRNSVASSPSVPGVPEFSGYSTLIAVVSSFAFALTSLKSRKNATFKYRSRLRRCVRAHGKVGN